MAQKTWVSAMKDYFGLNGKSVTDFMKEIKALTYKDRLDFHAMLSAAGINCTPPTEVHDPKPI